MRRRLTSLNVADAAGVAEATFPSSHPERNDMSLRGDSLRLSVAMQMERRRS